ncbi:hypothetical protein Tco_0751203 [Tanacetum coccineum]|uniref:Uncharacterized protein n=1 Tax=Tanacetum coccineum TaxID=301880 RepID=A0ABQ4Z466_9ASTR
MNGNVTNVSSSTHQEIHKIFKDEIVPIVNQVDARVQNFKNHFVKEAAKFVKDFKSLAKEADDSLDKIKVLEREIERLLRTVASQDIMSIVQDNFVVDSSNLQTELARTKEKMKNCIIKKETVYAKLWNLEITQFSRRRNRRRSRQQQEAIPIVDKFPIQMADDRPMAEQLQAPTGGFESAIVVPLINAQKL